MTDGEATSPAVKGVEKGSEGLTSDQAAARLFASAAKATAQKATEQAVEKIIPEESDEPEEVTTAEAQPASAETGAEETAPADQSATADEETAEAETEETADYVLSPATLDEKLKAKIQKRIDKEVGKRKALETRLAEMEAKLATQGRVQDPAATAAQPGANGSVPITTPSHPLAKINDVATLNEHHKLAKDAMRWAEDTLENPKAWKVKTEVDNATGEETTTRTTTLGKDVYDEAQIRAIRREAKIALEDHIPERRAFLAQQLQAQKTARDSYPFLNDKNSPEYAQAQSMLRDPWVQMRPDAEWIVGTQIMGIKALEAQRAAATKKAAPATPKAPAAKPSSDQAVVSASGSQSRISADTAKRIGQKAEREKLMEKGGITAADAAVFLERRQILRKP